MADCEVVDINVRFSLHGITSNKDQLEYSLS